MSTFGTICEYSALGTCHVHGFMMVDLEASAAFFWSQQAEMDRTLQTPDSTWVELDVSQE